MKFKEEPADIEVKDRLWMATEAEAMRFAVREAEEFVVGQAYSEGQKQVTSAAKRKGYPCGLIRKVGRAHRLGLEDIAAEALRDYREHLGLLT